MKQFFITLLIIALTFGTSLTTLGQPTPSKFTTGAELVKKCSGELNNDNRAWCLGFIIGFDQAHSMISYLKHRDRQTKFNIKHHGMLYCPINVTYNQAIKLIVRYLKNNPDKQKLPASYAAWYALGDKFSCNQ